MLLDSLHDFNLFHICFHSASFRAKWHDCFISRPFLRYRAKIRCLLFSATHQVKTKNTWTTTEPQINTFDPLIRPM